LISCSSACGPMRWCFPILLFEVARFGEFRVEGSDSRIASHCENKPPHFSWITPRHFEISPETTGHVTAHLRQVPSTCTNSRIDEPCATGLAHSPKLFYCHYDGPSGQTTVGPLNATPQYHSDGALSQVLVTLICPLANYTEMHRVAAGNGTVRLSVTHSIPNAPVATSIPFQGLADGDTITFSADPPVAELYMTSLNSGEAGFNAFHSDLSEHCSRRVLYFIVAYGCPTILLEAEEGICAQTNPSPYKFRTDLTTKTACYENHQGHSPGQLGFQWYDNYAPDVVGGFEDVSPNGYSHCWILEDKGQGTCRAALRNRLASLDQSKIGSGSKLLFVSNLSP